MGSVDVNMGRFPSGEAMIQAAANGLGKATLHFQARAQALAPVDTGNLVNSIRWDGTVKRGSDYLRTEVTATARSADLSGGSVENYAEKTHENMEYDGPNVGGSHTQGRGEKTMAKGTSTVDASDGDAGGKYLERPIRNNVEVYTKIIARAMSAVVPADGGGGSDPEGSHRDSAGRLRDSQGRYI